MADKFIQKSVAKHTKKPSLIKERGCELEKEKLYASRFIKP